MHRYKCSGLAKVGAATCAFKSSILVLGNKSALPASRLLLCWKMEGICGTICVQPAIPHRVEKRQSGVWSLPWTVQEISIRPIPGWVNFVPAGAYLLCLNLPAAFPQPWNGLVEIPCIVASLLIFIPRVDAGIQNAHQNITPSFLFEIHYLPCQFHRGLNMNADNLELDAREDGHSSLKLTASQTQMRWLSPIP